MRLLIVASLVALVLTGCGQDDGPSVADLQARVDSLQTANAELRAQRTNAPSQQGDRSSQEISLEPVYFPSGSAWLSADARRTLDSLAAVIQEQYPDRPFRIKGFTDDRPISPALADVYPSNWYLSAQRAAAVAHYLDAEHGLRVPRLEIGAYGPQDPAGGRRPARNTPFRRHPAGRRRLPQFRTALHCCETNLGA